MVHHSGATRDPWVLWLGQFATASTALYLLASGITFDRADADWFSIDARVVFVGAAVIGLLAVCMRAMRLPWLLALLVCSLGRCLTLIVVGSPTITSRVAEVSAAAGWWLVWVLGSFPVFAMQASDIIRGKVRTDG